MNDKNSHGICLYCNKHVSKSQVNRHMQKHLADKMPTNNPGHSLLIKIETNPRRGFTPYFLSLWVDGNTLLNDIDILLRKICLDCCGHMSAFINKKLQNSRMGSWDFFEAAFTCAIAAACRMRKCI